MFYIIIPILGRQRAAPSLSSYLPSFATASDLFHSRVFTLLPSLSYLHYVSFALLFTFLPALPCPDFRAIFPSFAFSTFLASLSWLHSPAFVFRRLHRPSPSALRFSCIYSCLHLPSTTYAIRRQTPSTTFFLVASISRCPISPHFPCSFSIFHFPHPPS